MLPEGGLFQRFKSRDCTTFVFVILNGVESIQTDDQK